VKKFGMDNGGHKRTPAATHLKLTKDENGISVDQSMYGSMIGTMLYLTASRPDITLAVGVCARYQADPKMSHLTQVFWNKIRLTNITLRVREIVRTKNV